MAMTGHDDHFTFFKSSNCMKDMIADEKYLKYSGECKVTNKTASDSAVLTFKEETGGSPTK
jgi:hypothetical protein